MYRELYARASDACCVITVIEDGEVISVGTGFTFTATGDIITAAHVILGQWPVDLQKYRDRKTTILAKLPGVPAFECKQVMCGIDIHVDAFNGPVQIDFAILQPLDALPSPVPFLPAKVIPPALGQEVFIAGYSEELEIPFHVDKLLLRETMGAREFHDALRNGYISDMTGPLIKRGVIGNIRAIHAQNSQTGRPISCEVFFVDNAVHPGASGGPIFDANGAVVGISTKRAITSASQQDAPNLNVPSGCTIGISLQPLLWFADVTVQ